MNFESESDIKVNRSGSEFNLFVNYGSGPQQYYRSWIRNRDHGPPQTPSSVDIVVEMCFSAQTYNNRFLIIHLYQREYIQTGKNIENPRISEKN